METKTLRLPDHYTPAIVNDDYSGLTDQEISNLNTTLALKGVSFAHCINVEPWGFTSTHDCYLTSSCNTSDFTFDVTKR